MEAGRKVESIRRRVWAVDRETVFETGRVGQDRLDESHRLRERGAYEEAVAALDAAGEEAVSKDPKALMARALARLGLGEHDLALADLDAAEGRLRVYLGAADINRAQIYNRQGRHREARAAAARAVERMPGDAWLARVSLASSCELAGDGAAAERALREMAAALAEAPRELRDEAASYVERMADLDALRRRVDVRALLRRTEEGGR